MTMTTDERPCFVCGERGHKRVEMAFGTIAACPKMEMDRVMFAAPPPIPAEVWTERDRLRMRVNEMAPIAVPAEHFSVSHDNFKLPVVIPDKNGDDTFWVSRAQFRSLAAAGKVRIEHEHIDHYDQYDWDGKRYRRWLSIPGVTARWDGGDPGDEDDGE